MHVVDRFDDSFVNGDNQVAGLETGAIGSAAGFDGDDFNSQVVQQIETPRQFARKGPDRNADAESRSADAAVGQQLANAPHGRAGRHGKTQPLSHGDDRRIDSNHAAARIQQRTARIARIERRRVLHDVFDQPTFAASQ